MSEVQEMEKIIQMNKTTEAVYNLAEALNQSTMNREDASELYSRILQRIYTCMGNQQCQEFTGVVSEIKRTKKKTFIYILNIFWLDVYISSHVVLTTKDDCDINRGDYIHFKSIITEYEDSNFGLRDFKLISKISEFIDLGCPEYEKYQDVSDILNKMSYDKKHNIYTSLIVYPQFENIQKGVVDGDFYNMPILSLYYRQLKEMTLHSRELTQILSPPEDMVQIIRMQLFVKYLQEEKKVTNPAQIIFCIVQFVADETSVWINDIAIRNGINRNNIQVNNNDVILYLKNNETFYLSNHMNEFNKYCSTLDILKN